MIRPELIASAAALVERHGVGDDALAALKQHWPALRFVACSDDDVPPHLRPVHDGDGYAMYLIAGGDHCLSLTTDAASAIGLVIAAVVADD